MKNSFEKRVKKPIVESGSSGEKVDKNISNGEDLGNRVYDVVLNQEEVDFEPNSQEVLSFVKSVSDDFLADKISYEKVKDIFARYGEKFSEIDLEDVKDEISLFESKMAEKREKERLEFFDAKIPFGHEYSEMSENENKQVENFLNQVLHSNFSQEIWLENEEILTFVKQGIVHQEVRDKFLSDNISIKSFLDFIMFFDQYDTHIEFSGLNIQLLEDEDVKKKIISLAENEEQEVEIENDYLRKLSFFHFHRAQGNFAFQRPQDAKSEFIKSLDIAEQIENNKSDMLPYQQATVAYFQKDIERLKEVLPEVLYYDENKESFVDNNYKIVKSFIVSLEKGDNPMEEYLSVYSDSRKLSEQYDEKYKNN